MAVNDNRHSSHNLSILRIKNQITDMSKVSKNSEVCSDINVLLNQVLSQIQTILLDKFVGMYIGGSIANNSFDYKTSDIDCYIVTTSTLPENMIIMIETIHKMYYSSQLPYAKRIEVSYIPRNDLLDFNPRNVRPYFNEGNFYLAPYGSNFIIELFMLREKGITIVGPIITDLIKEISSQESRFAAGNKTKLI